jgi:diguanylate cyclase (GGDEF)-like protein
MRLSHGWDLIACSPRIQVETLAQRITINLMQEYDLNKMAYNCSANIGVTMFNNVGISKEELLKQADMAMYKAKEAGRNGVKFFDPKM